MVKKNQKNYSVEELLAFHKSTTYVDVINTINNLAYPNKSVEDVHEMVIENFDNFSFKVGTLFSPELKIQNIPLEKSNNLGCQIRITLQNDRSYQNTGHDILHLLVKIFSAAITVKNKVDKFAIVPYPAFSEDCLALTFYRGKSLTPAETSALLSLLRSIQKSFRRREIETIFSPIDNAPDFSDIKTVLLDPQSTENSAISGFNKPSFLHSYSPFPYKLHSLDLGNAPDKVKINNKIFYVNLPSPVLSEVERLIRAFTGETIYLKALSKRYNKNTTYQALPCDDSLRDKDNVSDRDYRLDKYKSRSIRLSTTQPSIISSKNVIFYVYFPGTLIKEIVTFVRHAIGPRISMVEIDQIHEGHRCNRLTDQQVDEVVNRTNRQHSNRESSIL